MILFATDLGGRYHDELGRFIEGLEIRDIGTD
jgi:hypothetical protein